MHAPGLARVHFLSLMLLIGCTTREAFGSEASLAVTVDKVIPAQNAFIPAREDSPSQILGPCSPILGVDPDPVDFGPVELNQSAVLTVTLTDLEPPTPPCGITIQSIEMTLSFGMYTLEGLPSLPITVPADSAMTFQIRFTPISLGDLDGLMQIISNDVKKPLRDVSVRGEGVQNEPPVCDIGGPYTGIAGKPVSFDGTASSDADGTIISYAWDFGDGDTAIGPKSTHAYAGAGEFTVNLLVTDDDGAQSSCQTTALIEAAANQPPVCAAGGPYTGAPGAPIAFDGSASSDPDGTVIAYLWDFGDGATATEPTPSHTYAATGEYTVSLIITDDDGAPSSCSTTASVAPPPPIRAAVPLRAFGSFGEVVRVPVLLLDDVTGRDILAAGIEITYDPFVVATEDVTLTGTIGEGGNLDWGIEKISEFEELVRVTINSVDPIAGCGALVFVDFRATTDREPPISTLDLAIEFNAGKPQATALDGELIKGQKLGDTNCTAHLSPGDAAVVLQSAVGSIVIGDPRYPCLTIDTADVSGNEEVTAFDGSLILQHVLGLIGSFPIEDSLRCNGAPPPPKLLARGTPRRVSLTASSPIADCPLDVTLVIDDISQVVAGDFTLHFDPMVLRAGEVTPLAGGGGLTASRVGEGEIHLAVAQPALEPSSGQAAIARVRFVPLDGRMEEETSLALTRADLNEGRIPTTRSGVTLSLPALDGAAPGFHLSQNPWTRAGEIAFTLPFSGRVTLAVYDLNGRRVRALVEHELPAGEHSVSWDGRDDRGRAVAAGIYFYALDQGGFTTTRKTTVIR